MSDFHPKYHQDNLDLIAQGKLANLERTTWFQQNLFRSQIIEMC